MLNLIKKQEEPLQRWEQHQEEEEEEGEEEEDMKLWNKK